MAELPWQEQLRLHLEERNAKEGAFGSFVEQCERPFRRFRSFTCFPRGRNCHKCFIPDRRLAQQTKILRERNASLLRAVTTVQSNPSSSTVFVPGSGEECVFQDSKLDLLS